MLSYRKLKYCAGEQFESSNRTMLEWAVVLQPLHASNDLSAYSYVIQNCAGQGKGKYLSDIKPISHVASWQNITVQLFKAFLFPAQMVLNEMNQHALESMELDEDQRTDFDFNGSVQRHMPEFLPLSIRFLTVSGLKSCIEWAAVEMLPIKVAHRLSKDVRKSIARKLMRYSRFMACYKITYTALWSALPINIALFAYDMWLHIFSLYITPSADNRKKSITDRLQVTGAFCAKKLGFYGVCISCNALGYGIGSYIHTTQGGFLLSSGLELAAGTVFCAAVGI